MPDGRRHPEPLEREQVQPRVEGSVGAGVDRQPAEVGPRGGVLDDGQEDALGRRLPGHLDGQRRPLAVGPGEELAQCRPDEQRGRQVGTGAPPILHGVHDLCVEPEAGGEGEPAAVRGAQPDRPAPPAAQGVQQLAGRLDRVTGHAGRPGEHVGAAAGDDGQGRAVRAGTPLQHPVDRLVHRAVAAEGDEQVEPLDVGPAAQLEGVPAMVGVHDVDVRVGGQGVLEDVAGALGGGRRHGIHHEEGAHGRSA